MPQPLRLDTWLVTHNVVTSRARAHAHIKDGEVEVDGCVVRKPSTRIGEGTHVRLTVEPLSYASRGGLKLEAALKAFGPLPKGRVCVDVGASTGGFTDCCLRYGAKRVWAIDVGHGQLIERLREDTRVRVLENQNIRTLDPEVLGEACELAVIDCSFISLLKVLPNTLRILEPQADIVALIKPQFEVGRGGINKRGVVTDVALRAASIDHTIDRALELGLVLKGQCPSPVEGPAGNVEHLVWLGRSD